MNGQCIACREYRPLSIVVDNRPLSSSSTLAISPQRIHRSATTDKEFRAKQSERRVSSEMVPRRVLSLFVVVVVVVVDDAAVIIWLTAREKEQNAPYSFSLPTREIACPTKSMITTVILVSFSRFCFATDGYGQERPSSFSLPCHW